MLLRNPAKLAALCLLASLWRALAAGSCPFVADSLGQAPSNEIDTAPPSAGDWAPPQLSAPSNCSAEEYEALAREVVQLAQNVSSLPALVRLAYSACGTWSASGRSAGCNGGWMQYAEDAYHEANTGLSPLVAALLNHRIERRPCITFADLVTLGGAVAVEASGGPPIAWLPGRLDSLGPGPSAPAYSARLPSGGFNAAALLYYFTNLGLTVREGVALMGGGHSLGGASASNSGWNGSFTPFQDSWPSPRNKYFVDLVSFGWVWEEVPGTQRVQYVLAQGQQANYTAADGTPVIRLPSDIALRESRVLSYWAVSYALHEDIFVTDFQRVMQRYLHFGVGQTWEADTSYRWKGLKGDWDGYEPSIGNQLDTDDPPLQGASAELDTILLPLADWSNPYPTGGK